VTGTLLCVVLVGRGPGWTITVSGLAFLTSLIAVAFAAYQRVDLETERAPTEPTWWPQFERDFAEYVRLAAPQEQEGDSDRAS
jgi:hypothetical protein